MLYPDRYDHNRSDPAVGKHMGHCVEWLRQSLLCNADIGTITWAWKDREQAVVAHDASVHQCRNFHDIWKWARDHQLLAGFKEDIRLTDDIAIPRIYQSEDMN